MRRDDWGKCQGRSRHETAPSVCVDAIGVSMLVPVLIAGVCENAKRADDLTILTKLVPILLRRCPKCKFKLWPVGQVRQIRFHHLRHTTSSLLLMNGADLAAVQRIMRHQDPRTTTEFYGHLAAHYLHDEVARLSFGAPISADSLYRRIASAANDASDLSARG